MDSIKQLLRTATSPRPIRAVSLLDWRKVENKLNLSLPFDYKMLITIYHSGVWMELLRIFDPFTEYPMMNLFYASDAQLKSYRESSTEFPDILPFSCYPVDGGLFPYADTTNGEIYYWLTDGNPDSWSTVIYASRHSEYQIVNLPISTLLIQLIEGKLELENTPQDQFTMEDREQPFKVYSWLVD